MYNKLKNPISKANKSIKKTRKIITVLMVFFLISTVASTVASSATLGSNLSKKVKETIEKVEDIKEKIEDNDKSLKTIIQEKTQEVKEKTNRLLEKASELKDIRLSKRSSTSILNSVKSFITSIKSYFTYKNSAKNGLWLNAKYADYAPVEVKLRLLSSKKLDLNEDGQNDIRVRYTILPGLESKPLAVSFNVKLQIEPLSGFDKLDSNEFFEVYVEFYFPGILAAGMKGNRVQFGYLSEAGEEIPKDCTIRYTYIPYFFQKEKPIHITELVPNYQDGESNKDINIVFNYAHANNSVFTSKDNFNIKLEPASKTEIAFYGLSGFLCRGLNFYSEKKATATIQYTKEKDGTSFKAGLIIDKISSFNIDISLFPLTGNGGKIEYIRNSEDPIDATLFFEGNSGLYIYADDIPQRITLSWRPNLDGLIQLSSSSPVTAVGIRNAMFDEDATAKIYLSDLPTDIQLRWNFNLKNGEIDLFNDIAGCSAHVYSNDLLGTGGILQIDVYSYENINISAFWNFTEKYFGIQRTNSDISIYASLIEPGVRSADFYCEISKEITDPFMIYFDKTEKNSDIQVQFTSKNLTVSNLEVNVDGPNIHNLSIQMEKLVISKDSSISFSYTVNKTENTIKVTVAVEVTNGIYIENLSIWYNNSLVKKVKKIDEQGYWYDEYSLTIHDANIEWGGDAQNGYLFIHGGAGLTFTFNSIRKINGETIASASGSVSFATEQGLNISWNNNSGNVTFNIVGGGAISLSGFSFWLKDKLNIAIGKIMGSFNLNTEEKTGEIVLLVEDGSADFNFDVNLSFKGSETLFFDAKLFADIQGALEGELIISWVESNFTIEGNVDPGITCSVGIESLNFHYGNKTSDTLVILSTSRVIISGEASFSLSFSLNSIDFNPELEGSFSIEFFNFYVETPTFGPMSLELNGLSIIGSGYLDISYQKGTEGGTNPDPKKTYVAVTVYAEGSAELGNFDLLLPYNLSTIHAVCNFSKISLNGKLTFELCEDKISLGVYLSFGMPALVINNFNFNLNDDAIVVSWEELTIWAGGGGKITFKKSGEKYKIQSIEIAAIFNSLTFKNFEFHLDKNNNGSILQLNGQVTITSSGPVTLRASMGGCTEPYFLILISNGFLDVSNLYVSVEKQTQEGVHAQPILQAGFENLHIDGSFVFDLKVTENEKKDNLINIGTSGRGGISLNNAIFYANIDNNGSYTVIDINLEYFNFELDDLTGSVIDLLIDLDKKKFDIVSAGGSFSITNITIKNFNISVGTIEKPYYFNIFDFQMNFEGEGIFGMTFEEDEHGVHHLDIDGEITTTNNGMMEVVFVGINFIGIPIRVESFKFESSVSQPTVFHIDAGGLIDFNPEDPSEFLQQLYFNADFTSIWNITKIDFGGIIGFSNISGYGGFNVGAEYSNQDPFLGDLVIGVHGDLKLGQFRVGPSINSTTFELEDEGDPLIEELNINGDGEVKVDLLSIIQIIETFINSGNSTEAIEYGLADFRIRVIANTVTSLGFLKILGIPNKDNGIHIFNLSFQPGEFELNWNISSEQKYIYFNSTMDITIGGGDLHLGDNYKLNLVTLEVHEGTFSLEVSSDESNNIHIEFDNTGTVAPSISGLNLVDKKTGKIIFSAVELEFISIQYLKIDANLDFDGVGFLAIDTDGTPVNFATLTIFECLSFGGSIEVNDLYIGWDLNNDLEGYFSIDTLNQECYLSLVINDKFSIYGSFAADDFKIWWDLTGWLEGGKQGKLTFGAGFQLGININDEWYYYPSNAPDPVGIVINMPDTLNENEAFTVHLTNSETGDDISYAAVYYKYFDDNNNLIFTSINKNTGPNGEVDFIAHELGDSYEYLNAIMYASKVGYEDSEKNFIVYSSNGEITGYVKDSITNDPIPGATVTANPGGYTTTTRFVAPEGKFNLKMLPPNTYTVTTSKTNYQMTSDPIIVTVNENDFINIGDMFLVSTVQGYINTTIKDQNGNELTNVDIYLDGIFELNTGSSGDFIILKDPGTYSIEARKEYYYSQTFTINVNIGEATDVEFTLEKEWYTPNSHADPENKWDDETKAYDDDENTYAKSKAKYAYGFTHYIYFYVPQMTSDMIRFKAWYNSVYCNQVYIEVWHDGDWHEIYEGAFPDKEYVNASFGGTYSVTKVRVSFWTAGEWTTTADLYELDFHSPQ